MLDHVSIGVKDIARSRKFYDAALKPLGYSCLSEDAGALGYGDNSVSFWLLETARPVGADASSGLHFSVRAPTRQSVDTFHDKALAAGGSDNGEPGLREDYGPSYYAAFVTDPDGYRLEALCDDR